MQFAVFFRLRFAEPKIVDGRSMRDQYGFE
jgi:hypothetical protein